jgi:hypothetical protein
LKIITSGALPKVVMKRPSPIIPGAVRTLLESYPPQCGGTSLVVEGIDLKSIPALQEAGGVLWSAQPVEIEGTMRRGMLHVAPGGSHP